MRTVWVDTVATMRARSLAPTDSGSAPAERPAGSLTDFDAGSAPTGRPAGSLTDADADADADAGSAPTGRPAGSLTDADAATADRRAGFARSVALLLAVLGLVPAAAFATARPVAPVSTSALSGKTLTVTWTPAGTGRIEIAVRRPSGKRTKTTVKSVKARTGKTTITIPGAAPDRTKVRVRVRRCTGSGRAKRCSSWTGWATPPASPATTNPSPGSTPTTPTTGSTTPSTGAPVGTIIPGTTTPVTTAPGDGPTIGGCPQMPSDWALNQRVDSLPLSPKSDAYVSFMRGAGTKVHPDFGSADLGAGPEGFGIPFRVVPESTALVPIKFIPDMYEDESDKGDRPIPLDTPVEGGDQPGDRHVSVIQQGKCKLFELGNATAKAGFWEVSGSYTFDLVTGAPRPVGWTSADAAGFPIEPLLARYDEAASGRIKHAIRMTSSGITNAYIPPASHFAPSSRDPDAPPMGQRFRMKAGYDISKLTGNAKVIATAMKEYGLVLADTGSDWYVTGAPDRRWDDDNLNQLKSIPGSAFEAVTSGPIVAR